MGRKLGRQLEERLVAATCSVGQANLAPCGKVDVETPNWPERPLPAGTLASANSRPFIDIDDGRALAQAIVDTIREPLLVLDKDLRIVTASRSFYLMFRMQRQDVQDRPIYALGDGQWNVPELRLLLENIAPHHAVMDAYELERDFSGIGRRTMLLNARKVFYEKNSHTTILLAIEDVTERRAKEREFKDLLQQKEILLEEMHHRVANSLQIIASILLLKARTVRSEETRLHLQDAHQRVISVATVQQQLQSRGQGEPIEIGPYLSRLCETLAASMIGERRAISLKVRVQGGTASSSQAVTIGLIVTELVLNAIKHAFPGDQRVGTVVVAYDLLAEPNWRLTVSDNGIGRPEGRSDITNPGLGTTIIEALAKQLNAHAEFLMNTHGTTVSITHEPSSSQLVTAA
jgi:two-component sensor histidine kinase/PAS domain-containing protein